MNNRDKIKQLYNTYWEKLIYDASGILQDEEIAKDVVQIVFIKLVNLNITFDNTNHEEAYLYKAVHNRCLDELKKLKSAKRREQKFSASTPDKFDTIERHIAEQYRQRQMQKMRIAIDELPSITRSIIIDRLTTKLTILQIAQKHNLTIKQVAQHILKATSFLQNALKDDSNPWNGLTSALLVLTAMIKFLKAIFILIQ